MKGLGNIKFRGKMSYRPTCRCCADWFNGKIVSQMKDKSWQDEANTYFDMIKGESVGYDDLTEFYYQMIETKLAAYNFKEVEISYMEIVGKTVVWLDGNFKGYIDEWLEEDD